MKLNTPKSSSTIVPSSSESDNDNDDDSSPQSYLEILEDDLNEMGYTMESDPGDIWEILNKRCHDKFGFGKNIKEPIQYEELQWAEKTLSSYAIWDKFSQYHSLVEIWINKINIPKMQEGKNFNQQ